MTQKFYAQFYHRPSITRVDIVRETKRSVFLDVEGRERRLARSAAGHIYVDTFEEARKWLLKEAELRLKQRQRALEKAQGDYVNIKGMKP